MSKLSLFALIVAILAGASCSRSASDLDSTKVDSAVTGSAEDHKAIQTASENWYKAWDTKNYRLAAQDYSDDAVWVNAFGMKVIGRAAIEKRLKEVFALDFVMSGATKVVEQQIRFLSFDVALAESRVERVGQKTPSGENLGKRQTTHLRVFQKLQGRWQIVSHLISDARDRQRPQLIGSDQMTFMISSIGFRSMSGTLASFAG